MSDQLLITKTIAYCGTAKALASIPQLKSEDAINQAKKMELACQSRSAILKALEHRFHQLNKE